MKLLQEKNHENLILSSRYEKLLNRCEYFQRKTKESKFHNSNITEDLKLKNKNLHIEETKNLEQSKKVFMLNKLVTVLNSNNPRIIDQNNYKSIINDLIKENENLKRIIVGKEKELAHINEINNKLKNKSSNLSKKIEILQMNLNQNLDAPNNEKNQETWEEDQFSLLSEMKLPLMLDYRNQGVSPVFISILTIFLIYYKIILNFYFLFSVLFLSISRIIIQKIT